MAVLRIEQYKQKNGEDVLKVILKPTQKFPDSYFYCDASDEELVKQYSWCLHTQKKPYVVASCWDCYMGKQTKYFHQEKAYNILGKYPDCINHVDGIEFDNIDKNLDTISQQQNCWSKISKGYYVNERGFRPCIGISYQNINAKYVRTEVEACISAYQLELQYEDYCYSFLKDRRKDINILDLERIGIISEEEAIYRHVLRYADNAWYYYRYNLTRYFAENHIPLPRYSLDPDGYMVHPITGQKLCPL